MATATANTAAASVCSSRSLHGGERNRRPPLSSSRQSFDGDPSKSPKHQNNSVSVVQNSSSSNNYTAPSMTLTVPNLPLGIAGGAIPRTSGSSTGNSSSSATTPSSLSGGETSRRCFCGHFQESTNSNGKKTRTLLFGGGKKDRGLSRRSKLQLPHPSETSSVVVSGDKIDLMSLLLPTMERPSSEESLMDPRDHGMCTPPAPPNSLTIRHPRGACTSVIGLPTTEACGRTLERAHTDPNSSLDHFSLLPGSPPPPYDDVIKQKQEQGHRPAPPTYEEALNNLVLMHTQIHLFFAHMAVGPRPRTLTRARAEDIPDIYWEQAARELDFCTCRKCQYGIEHQPNHLDVDFDFDFGIVKVFCLEED
ncbi:unnamed protein product [Lepeophtheirus salmonis]|uniref:(salmon louse) hypothetical protein n=1 Tax=Lepeophtheirus salmonis TaxID=72036 RepID=A0A7R8CDB7_LEPSM|nr:unnamed protein product [Lepeophtheirus salmonis]CAF2779473.1 unnamed protein product [Lepeophtheirus salmonis]